jgi:hypothetical protein
MKAAALCTQGNTIRDILLADILSGDNPADNAPAIQIVVFNVLIVSEQCPPQPKASKDIAR